MNILFLALNYYPELVGCGKYNTETVNWFAGKADKIIVITTNPFYPEWKSLRNNYNKNTKRNIEIIRCPIYVPKNLNGITRSFHYLSFFISSFPIVIFHGLKNIDFAYTICPTILSAPSILILAYFKRLFQNKKLITWIHFQDLEIEAAFQLKFFKNKFLKNILISYEKKILKSFDFISSISFYISEKIKFKINKNKEIVYFPNFIESNQFISADREKELNPYYKELSLNSDKKVIMYSGTINDKLCCQCIVQTIELLKFREDLLWIICGEGPKKSYLSNKLCKLKNVRFYNFQPIKRLPDWLNLADIHLIPQKISSVKFCLPSKLLGILACGKAVVGIAPENSELGKILENHGIRLSNEDPKKMAESILKLIDNRKLREKLGKSSHDYIKKFHEKDVVLNNILLKILEHKSD